ncbi:MAG: mechanosensitive ion channel [Longimonas sp.]|uniref:mechanosensitive ion channel family protein n=1 Tax=Longimonas sp. TaxID=2039626 RepID=UPI003976304C
MDALLDQLTLDNIIFYGGRLVAAILIFMVAQWIAGRLRDAIRSMLDKPEYDKTLGRFGGNLLYYAIIILALLAALSTVGVEVASFIAILAAAGFAVGLALQGTLSNFAAGVMLLIFRPFDVEDVVEVGGERGRVRDIQLFYTRLNTLDNQLVIIPNSDVFGSSIRNILYNDELRVSCEVGTDYPADLDEARAILKQAGEQIDDRIEERGVQVLLTELGGSSINWEVRVWIRPNGFGDLPRVRDELARSIKYKLDAADIGIPYPQMDIHMDRTDAGGDGAA